MDFDPDRLAHSPFLPGLLGAIVSLKGAPGETWAARAFNVFGGVMIAGFVTPSIADWWHITSPGFQGGAAFALGLFGMNLVAAITQGVKDAKLGDAISSWITRR